MAGVDAERIGVCSWSYQRPLREVAVERFLRGARKFRGERGFHLRPPRLNRLSKGGTLLLRNVLHGLYQGRYRTIAAYVLNSKRLGGGRVRRRRDLFKARGLGLFKFCQRHCPLPACFQCPINQKRPQNSRGPF